MDSLQLIKAFSASRSWLSRQFQLVGYQYLGNELTSSRQIAKAVCAELGTVQPLDVFLIDTI